MPFLRNPGRRLPSSAVDATIACTLALGSGLPFADVLLAGRNFYVRDIVRTYIPDRRVLFDLLRAGEWPFWNRFFAAGQPLAANPHYHAFYPVHWLGLILPLRDAFHVGVVLHFPLAAIGMYLLMRSLGSTRAASVLAGLAWALSGTMASIASLVPLLFSATWIPWVMLFFRRYTIRRQLRDFALAALSLGLLLLAADVSIILQAGALIAAYAATRAWKRRSEEKPLRTLLAAPALILIATLAGAVQILPALDHQIDSGRAHPIPYETAVQWSFPPVRLAELVLPTLFGTASPDAFFYWGTSRLGTMHGLPLILSVYCGIPIAALSIAGLIRRIRGSAFLGIVAGFSFLLAIGGSGPFFPLLYQAGLRSLRYPEKFFVTATFAIVVLAALAADEAWRDRKVRVAAGIVAGIVLLTAATLTIVASLPSAADLFRAAWLVSDADAADFSDRFRRSMIQVTAVAAVTTALFLIERVSLALRATLLGALVVLDLGSYQQSWIPRIDASYYEPPPLAQRLMAEKRDIRMYSHADYQRRVLPQPPLPIGIRPWIVRNGLLPASNATWRIGGIAEVDPNLTMLQWTTQFHEIIDVMRRTSRNDRLALLMQMGGVSDMTLLQQFDPAIIASPWRFHEVEPVVPLRLATAGPVYFADRVMVSAPHEVVTRLLTNEPISPKTAFSPVTLPAGRGTVVRSSAELNSLSADVVAEERALLVVAVTRHKYWKAAIDGVETAIHPVNVAFQGVIVPPGPHAIHLRYRNPIVVACGYVSLLTALALLTAVIYRPRRTS
jgi:hypothetical protein